MIYIRPILVDPFEQISPPSHWYVYVNLIEAINSFIDENNVSGFGAKSLSDCQYH